MLIYKFRANFTTVIVFLLGFSLCVSTALMTNAYLFLVLLSFWQQDFTRKFKEALKNKFVLMSVIFYGVFIFSSLWSNAQFHNIWKMLVHIIFYVAAPFLFIIFTGRFKTLLTGFITGAMISAILSIGTMIFHHQILFGLHDLPGTVFHGHILHNAFLAIAATIFIVTILSKNYSLQLRIYAFLAYLICAFDVFFVVEGRTGSLMIIIMSIFSILCFVKKRGLVILLLFLLVLIPFLYKTPMAQRGIADYKSDMAKLKDGNVNSSMGYRIVFHRVSNELIKQKPILGYGAGSYAQTYSDYAMQHNIKVVSANPHRDILLIGVETGILGMITFILMLLAAIYEVIKLDKYYKVIGLSLILGYISASVENSFFMDNVTGIAFVVLMLAILSSKNKESL